MQPAWLSLSLQDLFLLFLLHWCQDSTDLVAKLGAFHNETQVKSEYKNLKRIALDLINGKPRDNKQAGVFEPIIVEVKSLKFSIEAMISVLQIDDLIKLHPENKDDKHGVMKMLFTLEPLMTDLIFPFYL
jgi:chaperonin GroEL (HSP60 family)